MMFVAPGCGADSKAEKDTAQGDTAKTDAGMKADQEEGVLPLFDGHSHFMPSWDLESLPDLVNDHGTLGMVLLGAGPTFKLQKDQPTIFLASAHVKINTELEETQDELFADLIEQLDGGARGIGELSIRHFATKPGSPDTYWDFNHPFLIKVYDEANKRGVPVNFHFDYDAGPLDTLTDTLPLYPDVTFIWAHSGDTTPENLEPFLLAHPNLNLDVSCRNSLEAFGNRPFPPQVIRMDDGNGVIQEGWKDLLEAYPDRVLFGSDVGPPGRLEIYAQILAYYRGIFSQLSPEIAAKVGHENAMRIYQMP